MKLLANNDFHKSILYHGICEILSVKLGSESFSHKGNRSVLKRHSTSVSDSF